jgi:RNA polymerase sigma-70 factor (ECF subfamily)
MIQLRDGKPAGRWARPEIVAAALAGDRAAVDQLVAAVWPGCFRLAFTVIGDRSLAQDAAQETCAIVLRKIRTLRSAAAFDAWLYRITMREAARVRRRNTTIDEPRFEPSSQADGTATIDVWRALATLSPELRDVTVLFYFDDLKTEEIAVILRVAHPTVRTRLARARERLRGILGNYGDEPVTQQLQVKHHVV